MPEFKYNDRCKVTAIRVVEDGEWKTIIEFDPPVPLWIAREWYERNGYGETRTQFL